MHNSAARSVTVTVTVGAVEAEAEAEEAILWAAAQTPTTQLLQTRHKLTARQGAVTGSKAIAARVIHEHP